MKFIIINGPNLNLLGKREVDIYGNESFDSYLKKLHKEFSDLELSYFQSNHEGEIIDKIQEVGFTIDGIVINPAAYSHYSIAILDALKAVPAPAIEIHISDISQREEFRQKSITAEGCIGCISGMGLQGYNAAIETLIDHIK